MPHKVITDTTIVVSIATFLGAFGGLVLATWWESWSYHKYRLRRGKHHLGPVNGRTVDLARIVDGSQ